MTLDPRLSFLADDEKHILTSINPKIVEKWFLVYLDPVWVVDQVRSAILYYQVNEREPVSARGWAVALTGWLQRSKEYQRMDREKKGIISSSPTTITETIEQLDARLKQMASRKTST